MMLVERYSPITGLVFQLNASESHKTYHKAAVLQSPQLRLHGPRNDQQWAGTNLGLWRGPI